MKFVIFIPCKDIFLANDNSFYTKVLNDMEEIDKVDYMWINPQSGMKVGTYLKTKLIFYTLYPKQWKHDKLYRQKIWDRLGIEEKNQ